MNALHSKATAEWFTPATYVEAARDVMCGIDIDPASCALANETVRAPFYFDKERSGLDARAMWNGRVFLNPPGGLVREFWRRLQAEWTYKRTTQAVWVGYSLQQLQTLQTDGDGPIVLASAICYPRRRIAFIDESGKPSKAPTHANYIAYLGPAVDRFADLFGEFGEVR
jgi:ParB family chromosome partitioning protein